MAINRFVRNLMYQFKRQYGVSIVIYKQKALTQSVQTGVVLRTFDEFLTKGIMMPVKEMQILLGTGKIDIDSRFLIVEKDVGLTTEDEVKYQDQMYTIKSITLAEDNRSYILELKHPEGSE